uniref:Serine protease inhibitor n=1 Tax=Rhipicephalus zambeziensis TaxID=60191 RepID=A0A224YER0_9ACAR
MAASAPQYSFSKKYSCRTRLVHEFSAPAREIVPSPCSTRWLDLQQTTQPIASVSILAACNKHDSERFQVVAYAKRRKRRRLLRITASTTRETADRSMGLARHPHSRIRSSVSLLQHDDGTTTAPRPHHHEPVQEVQGESNGPYRRLLGTNDSLKRRAIDL